MPQKTVYKYLTKKLKQFSFSIKLKAGSKITIALGCQTKCYQITVGAKAQKTKQTGTHYPLIYWHHFKFL